LEVAASVEEEAATEVMEVASLIHAADDRAPCTYIDDKGYLSTAADTRSGISVDCCRLMGLLLLCRLAADPCKE
jgi:hypothetical protein